MFEGLVLLLAMVQRNPVILNCKALRLKFTVGSLTSGLAVLFAWLGWAEVEATAQVIHAGRSTFGAGRMAAAPPN